MLKRAIYCKVKLKTVITKINVFKGKVWKPGLLVFMTYIKKIMINLKELTCTKPLKKVLEPLAYCIVAFITEAYNNYTLDLNDLQP